MSVLKALLLRRKFTLLAVVGALTLLTATTAIAGSGVGGVFNLGKVNTVNAITKLVGSVTGTSLLIDNNSTDPAATALNLHVEAGRPPMKVDSQTKVANLNSDELDGMHADALGSHAGMTTSVLDFNLPTDTNAYGGPFQTIATLPVSVPGNTPQVVRLDGYLELHDTMGPAEGCPCEFNMAIVDTTTNTAVGTARQTFLGTDTEVSNWAMSQPVLMTSAAPGSHTYELRAQVFDRDEITDSSFDVDKVRLIAQTMPFSN